MMIHASADNRKFLFLFMNVRAKFPDYQIAAEGRKLKEVLGVYFKTSSSLLNKLAREINAL